MFELTKIAYILIFATSVSNVRWYCSAYTKTRNAFNGSDFYDLVVQAENLMVDKTLMIREYLQTPFPLFLITRPKRWGKSINLNMLKRFLEIEVDQDGRPLAPELQLNRKLFAGGEVIIGNRTKKLKPLKIAAFADSMDAQGKFPVIYMSLKNALGNSTEDIETEYRGQVRNILERQHSYLRSLYVSSEKKTSNNGTLTEADRNRLRNYYDGQYGREQMQDFLRFIATVLYGHYKKRVHVLIDDYEIPVLRLFSNVLTRSRSEYARLQESIIYEKTIKSAEFIDGNRLLAAIFPTLKVNCAIEKTLISGTLELADLLRGVENSPSFSVLDKEFSDHYGFSQDELDQLLRRASLNGNRETIQDWYSGYLVGGPGRSKTMYNPWSVVNYIAENGTFNYYWIDGTHMSLISDLLSKDDYTKKQLRDSMAGQSINEYIRKGIKYNDLRFEGLIHILLFSGYLTPTAEHDYDYSFVHPCQIKIPNREVKHIFQDRILPDKYQ